jgi:hypothetical protein
MPVHRGRDAAGPYYQWGASGAKYRYAAGDAASRARAKALAARQGRAVEARRHPGARGRVQARGRN